MDSDGDNVTVIWNTTSPTGVKSRGNGGDIQLGAGKGVTTVYVCADDKDPTNGPGERPGARTAAAWQRQGDVRSYTRPKPAGSACRA
jgi:hypothetical protein